MKRVLNAGKDQVGREKGPAESLGQKKGQAGIISVHVPKTCKDLYDPTKDTI